MARSWVGLTILACLPCMGTLQSTEACDSYVNCLETEECYESAVVSSKNVGQTRFPPALRHKERFAYEYLLAHAITWRGMHVHAVLSSQEARILLITEERMARWLHRLDV